MPNDEEFEDGVNYTGDVDDTSEPTGSCERCGVNLYEEDDEILCD